MGIIEKTFGDRIRVRVCGLCYDKNSILLVKHTINDRPFYAPPGGAVEFGESLLETLKREFKEEVCLEIAPGKLLFTTEYIRPPLHAIELFFSLESWQGIPEKGADPEIDSFDLIEEVAFYSPSDIKQIPLEQLHHVFHNCNNPRDLLGLSGYVQPPSHINK